MLKPKKKKGDIFERFPVLKSIPSQHFPNFLFIIPDGNRRFAKQKGKPSFWGHKKGFDVAIELLRSMQSLPIKIVGFWGFSSDNWKRNEIEVKGLMTIFEQLINNYFDELMKNNGRLIHIGRKDRLPDSLIKTITKAEEKTKKNTGQILCIALDFGGEDQTIRMLDQARRLEKNITITPQLLHSLRDGDGLIPPADLIIRTSEIRTSDVGWLNGKNTVLYFIPDKFFPEMNERDIVNAIDFFDKTERRQGA